MEPNRTVLRAYDRTVLAAPAADETLALACGEPDGLDGANRGSGRRRRPA
jgi:hypothetical protein